MDATEPPAMDPQDRDFRPALAGRRIASLTADLTLARLGFRLTGSVIDDPAAMPADLSDDAFVIYCFRWLLGRDPDESGLAHFVGRLARGETRLDLIGDIVRGSEFAERLGFRRPPRPRRSLSVKGRLCGLLSRLVAR